MPEQKTHPITLKMVATTCINEPPVRINGKEPLFSPSGDTVYVGIFPILERKHPCLVERFTDRGIIVHFEWPEKVEHGFRKEGRISQIINKGYECPNCAPQSAGVSNLDELIRYENEALNLIPPHLKAQQLTRIEFLEHGKSFLGRHHTK